MLLPRGFLAMLAASRTDAAPGLCQDGLALRYVLAERGHAQTTPPLFDIPFVPFIEKGRNVYSMFVDLFKYPWVLRPPIEFATVKELLAQMPSEVIAPAEKRY